MSGDCLYRYILLSKQLRLIKIIIEPFSVICKDNINLPALNFIFSVNILKKILFKTFLRALSLMAAPASNAMKLILLSLFSTICSRLNA